MTETTFHNYKEERPWRQWVASLLIILTFVAGHLSQLIIQPLLFGQFVKTNPMEEAISLTIGWGTLGMNIVITIIMFLIIRKRQGFWNVFEGKKAIAPKAILWGFLGFLLAMIGQVLAVFIETTYLGIEPGSENTEQLAMISKASPVMIISIVVFAPLLEEIVFRRAIFGALFQKTNFFIAALISGAAFAAVHMEFEHFLVYLMPAFAFAFIYYMSKSIIAPIAAHFFMNSFVMWGQLNADKLEQYTDQLPAFIQTIFHL